MFRQQSNASVLVPVAPAAIALVVAALAVQPTRAAAGDDDHADAVMIQQTHWGFDGTLPPRTYVPVSFLVQNVTPRTVTVRLRLSRLVGFDRPIGTVLEQEVTLSGDSVRWVQFAPYVADDTESWKLSWGSKEAHQMDLPQVQTGPKATVLIFSPDDVTPAGGVLRRMPEAVFPTSITATDGLRGLIFQKPPYWQGARARAFLDWLSRGGRVYLLRGPDGSYPIFPPPLEVLNQQRDEFQVGGGVVKRIDRRVEEIDLAFARREMFQDDLPAGRSSQRADFRTGNYFSARLTWDRDYRIESNLIQLARFRRNWLLIYACVATYLLALWPGCYQVGRRCADYRWYYVVFLSVVVLFSALFIGLGRVGASNRDRFRSVAVARHLGEGVYDVTQWATVAAATGGERAVRPRGSGVCFSNSNEFEAVLGSFHVGSDARAEFLLPSAATRTFQQRQRLTIARPAPEIVDVEFDGGRLSSLTLNTAGAFPRSPHAALAIYGGMVYVLDIERGRIVLPSRAVQRPLAQQFEEASRNGPWGLGWLRQADEEGDARSDRAIYEDLFLPLLAAGLGINETSGVAEVASTAGALQIAVYGPMPVEFFPDGDAFPDRAGRVLYLYQHRVQGEL